MFDPNNTVEPYRRKKPNPPGTEERAIPKPSVKHLDIDNNDQMNSQALEDYLLERYPGARTKEFRDIIISEEASESRVNNKGLMMSTPGVKLVMADGRHIFSGYVGQQKVVRKDPEYLVPEKLRNGWAVWVRKDLVKIFLTKKEALGACVLYGAVSREV